MFRPQGMQGIPQTQSSTNAVRGFKSKPAWTSNPEPVPYSIAKGKMGSGPGAGKPQEQHCRQCTCHSEKFPFGTGALLGGILHRKQALPAVQGKKAFRHRLHHATRRHTRKVPRRYAAARRAIPSLRLAAALQRLSPVYFRDSQKTPPGWIFLPALSQEELHGSSVLTALPVLSAGSLQAVPFPLRLPVFLMTHILPCPPVFCCKFSMPVAVLYAGY